MANKFEDLEAQLDALDEIIDAPDNYQNGPEFLAAIVEAAGEAYTIAQNLTMQDYDAEMAERADNGETEI